MEERGFLSVCRFRGDYEWIWFRRDGPLVEIDIRLQW
jgi:hypothetical protein